MALHLDLPAAAQAYAAVGMRVGEQSLADIVNLFVQLIWNEGRLGNYKTQQLEPAKALLGGGSHAHFHTETRERRRPVAEHIIYLDNGVHQRVQQGKDASARVPSFSLERAHEQLMS